MNGAPPRDLEPDSWHHLHLRVVWAYQGAPVYLRWTHFTGFPIPAWYLMQGELTMTFANSSETIRAGMWYFPPEYTGAVQSFSKDTQLLSIRFIAEWPTGAPLFDRSRGVRIPAQEVPELNEAAERLIMAIEETSHYQPVAFLGLQESASHYFRTQGRLYDWLAAYTAAMRTQGLEPNPIHHLDERVIRALTKIDVSHFREPVREEMLARMVGLSRSQLNRLFMANLGQTPMEYWEKKRVQAAHLAITRSRQSLKEIAYHLGFASQSYFSTWVKKRFGASARQMRRGGIPVY